MISIQLALFYLVFCNSSKSKMIIDQCQVYNLDSSLCFKCSAGYFVSQNENSCIQMKQQDNCIQISDMNQCMRCDCNYVLSKEFNICVFSPPHLIGCEVKRENNTCERPKKDFTLYLDESRQLISIEFGKDSHCEIRTIQNGTCEQCHSGFQFDSFNSCIKSKLIITNEYFSYFSLDGELKSRDQSFIVIQPYGLFQKIKYCEEFQILNDNLSALCSKCQQRRILNESQTNCFKPPFYSCEIVSDSDPNRCIQCKDNNYFYLISLDNQQVCVLRKKNSPFSCLEYYQNSPICKQCPIGQINTVHGCYFGEDPSIEFEYANNLNKYYQNELNNFGCEYWNDNHICESCKYGMILDTFGNCIQGMDNCVLQKADRCFQCQSLMFYSEVQDQCIKINDFDICLHSSGLLNQCSQCINLYYISNKEKCERLSVYFCFLSLGFVNICQICRNLFYLSSPTYCQPISNQQNCLLSNGTTNSCLQCNNKSFLNNLGFCEPKVSHINGYCVHQQFYIQENPDEQSICQEYSFSELNYCYEFHPHQNECIECISGYYLSQGNCVLIPNCYLTDGINQWCFQEKRVSVKYDCSSTLKENTCAQDYQYSCSICKNEVTNVQQDEEYIPENEIPQTEASFCFHIKRLKGQNTFFCVQCINKYYVDENGICKPITIDECRCSNGKTNSCILCSRNFQINKETGKCEAQENKAVPFCNQFEKGKCLKCNSLYYLERESCYLIDQYLDCLFSSGIENSCTQCVNKLGLAFENNCILKLCKIEKDTNSALKLINPSNPSIEVINYILNNQFSLNSQKQLDRILNNFELKITYLSFKSIFSNKYYFFIQYKIIFFFWFFLIGCHFFNYKFLEQQCLMIENMNCLEYSSYNVCSKCKEGYYLLETSQIFYCSKILIDNCLDFSFEKGKCIKCQSGYLLLKIGVCKKLYGCIEFEKVCTKCQDDFFLYFGQCITISFCKNQNKNHCLECENGYSLFQHNQNIINSLEQTCVKIPNCIKSDGIREECQECKQRYFQKNGICLEIKELKIDNCFEYSHYDFQCKRCNNLHFLTAGKCKKIQLENCSVSYGILHRCERCSLLGFIISKEEGICRQFSNCLLSNGKDTCFQCTDEYLLDTTEGVCIQINSSIDNCLAYSFQKQIEEIFSNEIPQTPIQKIINQDNENIEEEVKTYHCIQCSNFYQIKDENFKECERIFNGIPKCFLTDGTFGGCLICHHDYIPTFELPSKKAVCKIVKKSKEYINVGCSLYFNETCKQCFSYYQLNSKNNCIPRNILSHCAIYSSTRDECNQCRNGYILHKITQEIAKISIKVCLPIEGKDIVENCEEYLVNTNLCIKCKKMLSLRVVEFILNKKSNKCENVLFLMCHEIDEVTKNCIQKYISNCQLYDSNHTCIQCQNGYYQNLNKNECFKSNQIKECLLYEKNQCLQCNVLFYLTLDKISCLKISIENCLIGDPYQDKCVMCIEQFVIEHQSGECITSQIDNCLITKTNSLSSSQFNSQTCLKCKVNFVIQENKCALSISDPNCELFNDIHECVKCKEEFFLTNKKYCISMNSICNIKNCIQYSQFQSLDETFKCDQCDTNYSLDKNKQCSPFDPDSIIQENQNQIKENIKEEKSNTLIIVMITFFSLGVLIFLIWKIGQEKSKKMEEQRFSARIQMGSELQVIQNEEDEEENKENSGYDLPNFVKNENDVD